MKFLIDEGISPKLASFLNNLGYSAIHIRDIQISLSDTQILKIAASDNLVVITEDTDFGKLVFKENQAHCGVILLRLEDQTLANNLKAVGWLLSSPEGKRLENKFIALTEKGGKFKVRFG